MFADPDANFRGTVTRASLQAVIEHIRASGWPADLVAMTGDLIQDGSAGAYRQFCRLLGDMPVPVHCIPGNHDVRALMQRALDAPPFHYCATFTRGAWLVVGIDSCKSGSAGGRVAGRELARLRRILEESTAAHVLVCLHHPPLSVGSRWLDRVGLENGDAFLRTVATAGNVRGCLFGHVHQAFDASRDGLRIIGTPSTCRQFLPGSDDFALDDRPPAYRRVLLQSDGSIDTELIWVDAAAEAAGT